MQVNISQELFIRKFTGKMPRPRLSPECGRRLCASLRSRNALQHFSRGPEPRCTLCASLRNRNAGQHFTRATLYLIRKFIGKMPRPRLNPERGHRLCASLRGRNALQHFQLWSLVPTNSQQITGFCSQNVAGSKEKCPRLENKKIHDHKNTKKNCNL